VCSDGAAEIERLHAIIEDAPHDKGCASLWWSTRGPLECNCWKSKLGGEL
jgi:hypothetical protein